MKKTWYLAIVSLFLVVSVVSYFVFSSDESTETVNLLHKNIEALADSELNRFASFVRDSLLSEDTAPHESIYEDMIQLYKDEIRKKDVWISRLFWCLAGIMMFILFVLVFDILNPTFGFVMY